MKAAGLALRHLIAHKDRYGWLAWKCFPWEATNGLHERRLIDPRSKARSVALPDEGVRLAEQLFGAEDPDLDRERCCAVNRGVRRWFATESASIPGSGDAERFAPLGRVCVSRALEPFGSRHPSALASARWMDRRLPPHLLLLRGIID